MVIVGYTAQKLEHFVHIQDGGRRHLEFRKNFNLFQFVEKIRHRCNFPVKYGDNRLNGSKVIL
jgi:hypothetical protein